MILHLIGELTNLRPQQILSHLAFSFIAQVLPLVFFHNFKQK